MLQTSSAPALVERLSVAEPDLQDLTTLIIREPDLISSLFDSIESAPSAGAKFAAAKLLQVVSGESSATRYPYFDSLLHCW